MLKKTKLYQELQKRKSKYETKIDEIYEYASKMLPKINRIFANYTGHGIEHSVNVMQYMYDLVTDISAISDLEITCLIYAALLHDIGMVANETEIEAIKKDELNYHGRKYSVIYDKYQNENIALQECVRPVHGERALDHIKHMEKDFFIIPEYTNCNFQDELAKICQAHTMNREWILQNLDSDQVKGKDELNAQYVAMLLRIADYLDIDEKRAPIELYRLLSPTGFGDEEWRQHYIIENKEKVVKDNASGSSIIVIYGQCNDSKIHRKFLQYLAGLSEELLWCTSYTRKYFEGKYWILLQPQIDNRIQTKGFEVSDLKLQMDYHAVVKLLMGEKLYGDKKYGLRELMQNAFDACRVMVEEAEHLEKHHYVPYVPQIQVILDYKDGKMIVMDNGIGMEYDVLEKYFLNIGKSYYKSDEFLYQGKSYCPIGTFGIGFLACFMLSDNVVVETKHYTEKEGYTIELEKDSEFVCKKNHVSLIVESGTAIILDLESVLEVFGQEAENIKDYLEDTFLDQGVQVQFITIDNTRSEETVNLKELKELNPTGISLDSYLNGISVYFNMEFDCIKVSRKFSDLCTDGQWDEAEREFAEYDFAAKKLYLKDMEGEELNKYIKDNHMMVIKIKGIKEDEKASYEKWIQMKSVLDPPPSSIMKSIYFPIKYEESMLKYRTNRYPNESSSGAVWNSIVDWYDHDALYDNQNIEWNIEEFFAENKMLMDEMTIELGIFPIISLGNGLYIEYFDDLRGGLLYVESETYWHGIKLDKGNIIPDIKIVGIDCNECVINILNKDISPNVARDDLMNDEREKIELAVERATYQYIVDHLTDDKKLQVAIQEYINENYSMDNPYYSMDSTCMDT